jgi:hypothetical protein
VSQGSEQQEVCRRFGVEYLPPALDLKVGIAKDAFEGLWPLNGLRHPPVGDTSGWYIWAGETLSEADDVFQPLHVSHLAEGCPGVVRYLGLPPGWRFLIAPGHEDVWFDPTLLEDS